MVEANSKPYLDGLRRLCAQTAGIGFVRLISTLFESEVNGSLLVWVLELKNHYDTGTGL